MPSPLPLHSDAYILVVDDTQVNVKLLLALLEHYGYRNTQGINDPRWIEPMLEEKLPDLILLDINMPYLSGHDVLRWLKQRWAEQAPPVIVLTAQTDRDTRMLALDLGARDFITKPFDQQEVMQRIRNSLEVHFLLKERHDRAALLQSLVEKRTADIERLSREDPVTQLPNRRALLAQLDDLLHAGQPALLYFLALEGMDEIARLHGHAMSEALSLHLRDRLLEHFGAHGTLGVWNSNKWLLITRQPLAEGAAGEQALAILRRIAQPFAIDQIQVHIEARIGISHTGMPHQSAEQLLRLAALALPDTSSGWRLYQPSIEDALQKRIRLHEALRIALDNQQFFLVYQPKIDLRSGRVIGAEALLRWVHPELGFISPVDFIPMAEASGEILRIGDWVIDRAIRQLEEWLAAHQVAADFHLAVNVSVQQLTQPDFARSLLHRLLRSRLPAGALEVEVTESGLMENVDLAREQLQLLSRHRVSVAIDDFGTGHSSLAYLKTLPVSVLKIDRAFVSSMDTDPQDQRLAETVIDMARNFDCTTVAEGVEKPEQAQMLIDMGCEVAQGYWYSPPLKVEQFIEFCAERRLEMA
ncbi:EAL domain, c-di-GMP-specific phosphodiesterase class I (or its enzymatically inactive variant) [Geopseudomonas sagittaria]|uniref:EAL domain, c-di-GMP-specific phosphodiesterase class I (Or its enzymatically inactive variant) n=1 Tax=Geopseudomonas sagittaria TaxID=1135990 RepID=A0A1I5QG63_9GAMM|nr:EAL domain-containing protein [Pseudomonas sagittaria]SFP45255.1 EAL domain, c-di-GMP-specific phosphodiesterase class I (or its enzymatically inactive variant) [Pseudomonas sagittaria]